LITVHERGGIVNVTVLGTGGTIASTAGDSGATPTKSGAELVDAVPELQAYATVTVEQPVQTPSFELDAGTLERIGDRVEALDTDLSTDAVVVTHGTDTLEETALYLDVARDPATPVFVTGAQRRPDELSADGPGNLQTAFRAAAAFAERNCGGVYVAFDETVHSARDATKRHASKRDAFASPNAGPVATVDREGVHVTREPRSETPAVPATSLAPDVPVVKSGAAVGAGLLPAALDLDPDGVVLEGTGLGNTTAAIGDLVREAAAERPVVVTTRCPEGRVTPVYGGDGGGERLREAGAIFAADLPAHKARLTLMLAISAYDERERIRDVFEAVARRGRPD
jgi:L-asparaginase